MRDPSEIRTRFVEVLRGIPELVSMLAGNPENIIEYVDEQFGDLNRTIQDLRPPSLLCSISDVGAESYPGLVRTTLAIAVRGANPYTVLTRIIKGVSTASGCSGQNMLGEVILPYLSPMKLIGLNRQFIYIAEFRTFDYMEIRVLYTDKG
jgi:hypothetical protein